MNAPRSLQELMAHAHALEREAVERYTEFADVLETHNNGEVAALFRTLAAQEAKHAEDIQRRMGWAQAPAVESNRDAPEAPPLEEAHYLMKPWHAVQIALEAERRAKEFFASLAERSESAEVKAAALELMKDETEHIEMLQAWAARLPVPAQDWAEDPDPPRYND